MMGTGKRLKTLREGSMLSQSKMELHALLTI